MADKVMYWNSNQESDITFGDIDGLSEAFAEQQKNLDLMKGIAFYDKLTNLRNRSALEIDVKSKDIHELILFFIDVNGLKYINDNYGHTVGDELIKKVANVLKNMFGDNAYRLGGDEFAVLIDNRLSSLQIASKIRAEISNQKLSSVPNFIISVAIGASNGNECVDFSQMMKKADNAMYQNKQAIKSTNPQLYQTNNKQQIPREADFIVTSTNDSKSRIGYLEQEKDYYEIDYKLAKKNFKMTLIKHLSFTIILIIAYFVLGII